MQPETQKRESKMHKEYLCGAGGKERSMDIILEARTNIDELNIDFVELQTPDGVVAIDWDETQKSEDDGHFHMCGERIYLNEERPDDRTWNLLEKSRLSAIQIYAPRASEEERELITITGLSFEDENNVLAVDVSDAHPRKTSCCEDCSGRKENFSEEKFSTTGIGFRPGS